ncbi:MAG: aminotransferase class III-fold pyridoxal phosphate-dependent enzyme [Bacteroidia bacterium]|nr:aminotransferase class III-fold pyridoxal phosphate-dependent enzyme [Bacteroidia bacterium]
MNLFDVYPLWNIEPVKGEGCKIWDKEGKEYLDLYGGHAVISIGHSHPTYVKMIAEQAGKLGFYSNSVQNSLQKELAKELGEVCGYPDYALFLCNSGAEANENALKLASFHTGRKKILALNKAFHGRTSGAVEATDNPKIQARFNSNNNVVFVPINDIESAAKELDTKEYAAFIIEGIQGVAGIFTPDAQYLKQVRELCTQTGTVLILDEIQSGYGRSGKFFAHHHTAVKADIVSMAKGIANGFPVGAIIVSPEIKPVHGMLGTTFGGNHLACAAALAVLKVIKEENLIENAAAMGEYLKEKLQPFIGEGKVFKELRGTGLMIGLEVNEGYEQLRNDLLFKKGIFTGGAGKTVMRLLPPLCVNKAQADQLIESIAELTK